MEESSSRKRKEREGENAGCKKFKGSKHLRLRLVLATLARMEVVVEEIRWKESKPGLCNYEIAFLDLLKSITTGSTIQIDETKTSLRYKPGTLEGGRFPKYDCGTDMPICYFLESLIVLGLFGKQPLCITLEGITNDSNHRAVDTFRTATSCILERLGIDHGLYLTIKLRGIPPYGCGVIVLDIPNIPNTLSAADWTNKGEIKNIRGSAFSINVLPENVNLMISTANKNLRSLTSDVFILSDYGAYAPPRGYLGYGMCLVVETTTKCVFSVDVAYTGKEESGLECPEELGKRAVSRLTEEFKQGGVVDSVHKGLLFILCALRRHDVPEICVGKLTEDIKETLTDISEILGVTFDIKPGSNSDTVLVKCIEHTESRCFKEHGYPST